LLLAPYAAAAAVQTGKSLELHWSGVIMAIAPESVSIEGDPAAVAARSADWVRCRLGDRAMNAVVSRTPVRTVDAETWSRLSAFAQRTFAPATEASRLAGAGAGLTDND
ncbi:MAG: DUF3726 domain-containing protein, partial [Hyphomicrobiaceae bacterium]